MRADRRRNFVVTLLIQRGEHTLSTYTAYLQPFALLFFQLGRFLDRRISAGSSVILGSRSRRLGDGEHRPAAGGQSSGYPRTVPSYLPLEGSVAVLCFLCTLPRHFNCVRHAMRTCYFFHSSNVDISFHFMNRLETTTLFFSPSHKASE